MLPNISVDEAKVRIAKRVAMEFKDGDVANLGIGIPSMVMDYVPKNVRVILETENGMLGMGPMAKEGEGTSDIRVSIDFNEEHGGAVSNGGPDCETPYMADAHDGTATIEQGPAITVKFPLPILSSFTFISVSSG